MLIAVGLGHLSVLRCLIQVAVDLERASRYLAGDLFRTFRIVREEEIASGLQIDFLDCDTDFR